MELANENLIDNIISKQIVNFPIDNVDTSWMTKSQKNFFEILKNEENKNKKYNEICELAGYKSTTPWYKAIKDERFFNLLESIGINVRLQNDDYPTHNKVEYIKNPKEREEYLKNDIWDMRRIFENYPRHLSPYKFIVNFTKISNDNIRKMIKRYFTNMLNNWQPVTFRDVLYLYRHFFESMYEIYPNINTFSELDRKTHIEKIINNMSCSKRQIRECLKFLRSMFKYMYDYNWDNAPKTDALIVSYDIPKRNYTTPRPIPPNIKVQLDDYIENTIIPLLEDNQPTPIIEPQYWDLIIIIRNTGRRFEDICHLIAEHKDKSRECLQYDLDEDPMLYLDHRIAKIPKDLRIPLAHLKDPKGNNMVEKAILRQMERVKELAPAPDGYNYLFREIKKDNRNICKEKIVLDKNNLSIVDSISYSTFQNTILSKISNKIPLKNMDGSIYQISAHQFRHTVATEMIDAGVDIYAVKQFLGHSSVAMTEQYIKVYQQRLKKEFKEKLSKSDATDIKNNLSEQEELYDNKWVKNKIIGIFELGDGCCEHPYKMPSCPHMACKTCVKKKIYPRHLQAVKDTIESETIHKDNALRMGLNEKAEEFDKIVRFYTVALEIINKGETFEASKHFYVKGVE